MRPQDRRRETLAAGRGRERQRARQVVVGLWRWLLAGSGCFVVLVDVDLWRVRDQIPRSSRKSKRIRQCSKMEGEQLIERFDLAINSCQFL